MKMHQVWVRECGKNNARPLTLCYAAPTQEELEDLRDQSWNVVAEIWSEEVDVAEEGDE